MIDMICDEDQVECSIITSLMTVLLPVVGEETIITIHSAAALSIGRYRLLNDMDANSLGQYDSMQLADVDFIHGE